MVCQRIVKSSGATAGAQRMVLHIGNGEGAMSDESWEVTECERGWGFEPQKALAKLMMPPATRERTADGSFALSMDGALSYVKLRAFVTVARSWVLSSGQARDETVFAGRIQVINPVIADEAGYGDHLALMLLDFRHDLKQVRVVGRHIYDPNNVEDSYQQGWPAHFNPGGRPNCIFDPNGEPRFSPYPDYGLENDEEPPDQSARSATKACYWTLENIFEYLRLTIGPDAPDQSPELYGWLPKVPDFIVWPAGLGGNLDTEAITNFNDGAGQGATARGNARKGREILLEGMDLMSIFEALLSTAGPWTINLEPIGDAIASPKSVLSIEPTIFTNSRAAFDLPHAIGASIEDSRGKAYITGGSIELDATNYASALAASTGLVKFERNFSTASDDTKGLEMAWKSDRFDAFCKRVYDLGNDKTAFGQACQDFPDVLTFYGLTTDSNAVNFMEGSLYEDYPAAKIRRPALPAQLSRMPNKQTDFATYPLWVEVLVGDEWNLAPEFSGLNLWDNGIIEIASLRQYDLPEPLRNWEPGEDGDPPTGGGVFRVVDGKANIVPRDIRINLAIPADHRKTFVCKLPNHSGNVKTGVDGLEVLPDAQDAALFAEDSNCTHYIDMGDLYQLWIRTDKSAPAPRSENGLSTYKVIRDDTDEFHSNVRRRLKQSGRAERHGHLRVDGYLGALQPGTQIKTLSPLNGGSGLPLFAVVKGVRWLSRDRETKTYYDLA